MIVVDSSALLGIIFDEPERQSFEDLITAKSKSSPQPT